MTSGFLTRAAAILAPVFVAATVVAAAVLPAPASAAAAPVAVDDAYAVVAGQTLTVPAPGVLGNDTGKPDGAVAAKGPENHDGFLLEFNGSFTYTPPVYVSGVITVTYCVGTPSIPPSCLSPYASIRITVTGPTAVPDAYTVVAGQTLTVPAPGVLANDLNVSAGTLVAAGQSNGGSNPLLEENGALTWTPAIDAAGVHTFKYCIMRPGPPACITDYATFTITVATPVAVDDAYTVAPGGALTVPAPGVLGNDTNVPPGTIASWQQPPPAGLTLNDDGGITWTAPTTPGVFTFPYCIVAFAAGPQRRCVSNNATVTVTVAVAAPPTTTTTTTTPATPTTPADPNLPLTGTSIWMTVVIGLVLVGAGAGAVVLGRRRRA